MERVQLNGADIEYDVRGSGAPVVFIHGAILSDGFVPVIEQTGIAENFQIVHYRRRGYARSSRAVAGMTMQGWAGVTWTCPGLVDTWVKLRVLRICGAVRTLEG